MAIEGFKEIVDRKGYKVESEDRKIFEREIGKSYFGLGNADMIEFILFDSNENQLPQGEDGKLVRYIHLNDANIKDYFLISDNNFTKKINGSAEFIVDIERLVREAGYDNGIFKTQVTLLNRRAGSENGEIDKLWIHEISPSRTEMRILPIKKEKQPNADLDKRYEVFTENKQFRDDTIYYAKQYIQNITTQKVLDTFSTIKGTQKDTETYHGLIRKEFKIESIEIFINTVRDKFIESINYFIDNREWDVLSLNYGKPKNDLDLIELSIDTINQIMETSLKNILNKFLPKRTIQEDNELTPEEQVTFDEVKQILKSAVSDNLYDSTVPDKVDGLVRGCMDPKAKNFNPAAQEEDGSCFYEDEKLEIKGCTDINASNYNEKATIDDGSCQYDIRTKTQKYYVWSERGDIKFELNGVVDKRSGIEYDMFEITHDDNNTIVFKGDIRTVPKLRVMPVKMGSYRVVNLSRKRRHTGKPIVRFDDRPYQRPGEEFGLSYGHQIEKQRYIGVQDIEESVSFTITEGQDLTFKYKDVSGKLITSDVLTPNSYIIICAQLGSVKGPSGLEIIPLGACVPTGPVVPLSPDNDRNATVRDSRNRMIELGLGRTTEEVLGGRNQAVVSGGGTSAMDSRIAEAQDRQDPYGLNAEPERSVGPTIGGSLSPGLPGKDVGPDPTQLTDEY